jgi:superfamily II DNA helicase RecQ
LKIDEIDKIEAGLKLYNSRMETQIAILKDKQTEALLELMEGDVLCVLPTGFGKSPIFDLLPYVCSGCTVIVISPLNAIVAEFAKLYKKSSLSLCTASMLHTFNTFYE